MDQYAVSRRFFELLLKPGLTIGIHSYCAIWRARQWSECCVSNVCPDYAARWVHEEQGGAYAYASAASHPGGQIALAVKLIGPTAASDLAVFALPATFAVLSAMDEPLYAVWALAKAVRWCNSNLPHALARRLSASAVNRIPVPGTKNWELAERFRLVEVSGEAHAPEDLELRLKSMRRRRSGVAAPPRRG
jgi:hypothetical protein